MPTEKTRRSDRITVELHITVSGTDAQGVDFVVQTHTAIVGRHGAKIVLSRTLVPDQELTVRCEGSGRESDVRVVGRIGEDEKGTYYGVEFLDPEINLWDIEFPPLVESEKAVERLLLECLHCKSRELTYLDEFEAEVFEANQILSRACKRCTDTTLWRRSAEAESAEPLALPVAPASPAAAALRTQNERKETRVDLHVKASVRSSQFGEELVATENISRGGFGFKSPHAYTAGMMLQVSVPYSPGAANIFTPARVARVQDLPEERTKFIGVAYVPVHKGWPGK